MSPDVGSDILAFIPNGSEVTVLAESGSWRYVRWQEQTGYVLAVFLQFQTQTPQATARPAQTYAYVNTVTGGLNMRQSASSNA